MNANYVAGFFDGEGSAMVLTIRRTAKAGVLYRFRPVIKIAQGNPEVLHEIKRWLGFGTVVSSRQIWNLQINGNQGVVEFVDRVAGRCVIKGHQLAALKRMAEFQIEHHKANMPYSIEDIEAMVSLRDEVFTANTWSRSRLKQKYSRELILRETVVVDRVDWNESRESARSEAHARHFAERRMLLTRRA